MRHTPERALRRSSADRLSDSSCLPRTSIAIVSNELSRSSVTRDPTNDHESSGETSRHRLSTRLNGGSSTSTSRFAMFRSSPYGRPDNRESTLRSTSFASSHAPATSIGMKPANSGSEHQLGNWGRGSSICDVSTPRDFRLRCAALAASFSKPDLRKASSRSYRDGRGSRPAAVGGWRTAWPRSGFGVRG